MAPSSIASAMLASLPKRDLTSSFDNAKSSLSSWSGCMSETYCKWPVIIGIIIVSLLVLSIVFCLARCLCCGLECCCGICACCNACCPSPRGKRREGKGDYNSASQSQGFMGAPQQYQSQAPMGYGQNSGPQYAQFDASMSGAKSGGAGGLVHEDALPAMPSWANATSRRIEDTSAPAESGVEMEKLDGVGAGTPHARNNSDESRQPMLGGSPTYGGHDPELDPDRLPRHPQLTDGDLSSPQYGRTYGEHPPVPSQAQAQSQPQFSQHDGYGQSASNPYGSGAATSPIHPHHYQPGQGQTTAFSDRTSDYASTYAHTSFSSPPPSYHTRTNTFPNRQPSPYQAQPYSSQQQQRQQQQQQQQQQQSLDTYDTGYHGAADRYGAPTSPTESTQYAPSSQMAGGGGGMPQAEHYGGQSLNAYSTPSVLTPGRKAGNGTWRDV